VLARAIGACLETLGAGSVVTGSAGGGLLGGAPRLALVVDRGRLAELREQLNVVEGAARRGEVDAVAWLQVARAPVLSPDKLGISPVPIAQLLTSVLRLCTSARQEPDPNLVPRLERLRRAAELIGEAPLPHDHTVAIRPLWSGVVELDGTACGQGVRPCIVVIDDDTAFCTAAEERLSACAEVHTFSTFRDYLRRKDVPPVKVVDLFLIDLVEGEAGGGDEGSRPRLSGLEEVLPRLRRERGLRPFPQLYAVSVLPVEKAGHIAQQLGADYYLDKTLLLAHPDPARLIGALLWHTTEGLRRLSVLPLPDDHGAWPGWAALADEIDLSSTEAIKQMAWSLYGSQHHLKRIDLLEHLTGGLSGVLVVSVQPRLADEGADGASRPMAPRIVKRDHWWKMADEWSAYHAHIAPLTTRGFARVEPFFWRDDQHAVISYTLAGAARSFALGQIVSLRTRLVRGPEQPAALVRRLFTDVLDPLHTSVSHPRSLADVVRFMARELDPVPVHWNPAQPGPDCWPEVVLVSAVAKGEEDRCRLRYRPVAAGFPVFEIEVGIPRSVQWLVRGGKRMRLPTADRLIRPPHEAFADLLGAAAVPPGGDGARGACCEAFFQQLQRLDADGEVLRRFEQFVHGVLGCREDRAVAYWSVVHGDLNLSNVLCDEDTGDLWVIDFAKTRLGPPAIDFIVFEMACRLEWLAGPLAAEWVGVDRSGPEAWLRRARAVLEAFERSTVEDGRVDLRRLAAAAEGCHPANDEEVRRGWQAILAARQLAFDTCYRGPEARLVYDLILALYCLRALQRYRSLVATAHAPLGALWAQVFERAAAAVAAAPRGAAGAAS